MGNQYINTNTKQLTSDSILASTEIASINFCLDIDADTSSTAIDTFELSVFSLSLSDIIYYYLLILFLNAAFHY